MRRRCGVRGGCVRGRNLGLLRCGVRVSSVRLFLLLPASIPCVVRSSTPQDARAVSCPRSVVPGAVAEGRGRASLPTPTSATTEPPLMSLRCPACAGTRRLLGVACQGSTTTLVDGPSGPRFSPRLSLYVPGCDSKQPRLMAPWAIKAKGRPGREGRGVV